MQEIRTEQRYEDAAATHPIAPERNVYEGDTYMGVIRQWPDGRWCYGSRDQTCDTAQAAARERIAYKHLLARMPEHGAVVLVHSTNDVSETMVAVVDATRFRVVNGKTVAFVRVTGSLDWHDVDNVRTV